MLDREKIIKEFKEICEYTVRPHEFRVMNDILTLLKEQEMVESHKWVKGDYDATTKEEG